MYCTSKHIDLSQCTDTLVKNPTTGSKVYKEFYKIITNYVHVHLNNSCHMNTTVNCDHTIISIVRHQCHQRGMNRMCVTLTDQSMSVIFQVGT